MINSQDIKKIYEETLLKETPKIPDGDNNPQYIYIKHYIPKNFNSILLDAGCGNGNYAYKLFSEGYKNIFAVDLFDNIKTECFIYKKTSIDDLPFNDTFFDFIYSNSVIYYLNFPVNAIKEFQRVLKPSCKLIITAHTKYSLFTFKRILLSRLGFKKYIQFKWIKLYSTNEYIKMLTENGFKIIRVDGYNLSFIVMILIKLIINGMNKYFHFNISHVKNRITKNKLCARFKSIFAYHLIIIAEKINE